jgi:hypothetical protein
VFTPGPGLNEGVNEGVNISPRGQISPLGVNFTPKSEVHPWGPGVKLRMALWFSRRTKGGELWPLFGANFYPLVIGGIGILDVGRSL